MHQIILGHDQLIADFVASLIPECRLRGFGNCRAIGVANEDGQLLGGVVYRNWFPEVGTIELSGAALPGTNWLSRKTLQAIYDYPFYVCGCHMVIQTTMEDNEAALLVKAKLGFTLHRIKHLGGRGRDGIVGTFTVDDWENCKFNANRRRTPKPEQYEEAA